MAGFGSHIVIDPSYFLDNVGFNNIEVVKYAEPHWKSLNENLWIGEIDVKHLSLEGEQHINILLDKFFEMEYYKFNIETIEVNQGVIPAVEQIAKTAYLLNQYFKSNSFRDPICTHFNPRQGKHVVHPGGTRQVILDLFHTGKVKTFYFNTRGSRFKFLSKLKKIDLKTVMEENYYISVVPDHGTFIPHIVNMATGVGKLPTSMTDAHNTYKKNLLDPNYCIYSNFHLKWFSRWNTVNQLKASVCVIFKQPKVSLKTELKATLLILSGNDYNDNELIVTHRVK